MEWSSKTVAITVLIGLDVVTAHLYEKVRIPPSHLPGPAAFQTPFGWCLGGKKDWQAGGGGRVYSENISGGRNKRPRSSSPAFLDRSGRIKKHPNSLKTGQTWRTNPQINDKKREQPIYGVSDVEVRQPSSSKQQRYGAERLFFNDQHCAKDLEYAQQYKNVIQDYIRLEYEQLLTSEQAKKRSPNTWYLCHFGAVKKTSTSIKVRVFFDRPTEFEGKLLSDHLLRGSNCLISVLGVLHRFRSKPLPPQLRHKEDVPPSSSSRRRSRCLQVPVQKTRR